MVKHRLTIEKYLEILRYIQMHITKRHNDIVYRYNLYKTGNTAKLSDIRTEVGIRVTVVYFVASASDTVQELFFVRSVNKLAQGIKM